MADERAAYSRYNVIVAIILTFASLTFGYSNAVISNTVGEPGFLSYFNLVTDPAYGNSIEGAINGVFFAGEFFGAVLVMTICDRIGRKKTATVACILSIIGGALQAGSVKIAMFLVARFITGVGIGTVVIVTPIYQAEISPAKSRGLFVGQHGEWDLSSICEKFFSLTCLTFFFFRILDCAGICARWLGWCRNILFHKLELSMAIPIGYSMYFPSYIFILSACTP